jgi:quercetin dioxygenase-like cupin family protein
MKIGESMRTKKIVARATNLLEILKYQAGAIVSREIIKKKTGTVTLFAFDKGQGLSEHTAPFDAVVYVVDGTALINIAKKSNTVRKGEMIVLPANVPHALKAVRKFKMLLVMIKA